METSTKAQLLLFDIQEAESKVREYKLKATHLRALYDKKYNPVKVGDKVTIRSEYTNQKKTVEVVATLFQTSPEPLFHYRGVVLTKDGKPSKRHFALAFFTEKEIITEEKEK